MTLAAPLSKNSFNKCAPRNPVAPVSRITFPFIVRGLDSSAVLICFFVFLDFSSFEMCIRDRFYPLFKVLLENRISPSGIYIIIFFITAHKIPCMILCAAIQICRCACYINIINSHLFQKILCTCLLYTSRCV